ncbi:MAG: histidine kinase [Sphingomonas bacterium]|nr:histidine kinase [Sphingomonas bacterium]
MAGTEPITDRHGEVEPMRFDDMLATVLAQPLTTPGARIVAWRQVVDLIGQRRVTGDDPVRDRAYVLLRDLRSEVSPEIRSEAALALAGRRLPVELVAFFAEEAPQVVAPLIARARLDEQEWLGLLPALAPTMRGLLRNRRDLPDGVVRGLASFGASDFALDAPAHVATAAGPPAENALVAAAPVEPSSLGNEDDREQEELLLSTEASSAEPAPAPQFVGEQIRDLMARIEAYRRSTPLPAAEKPGRAEAATCDAFRFETGPDGVILWVEDAPRGPLIGVTIATAAERFDHGVDGHAAGAYRQRAPFRDARLSVAGTGAAAGEWRISAVPFFDPQEGRFTGYRGTARRPRPDETALGSAPAAGLHGTGVPPDSLRQLVHELRTPINAIVGFAEMIERQLLGPAAREYRSRAVDIVAQGRRLLATVDDLDLSARMETERLMLDRGPVDAASLLARLQPNYERVASGRGAAITLDVAGLLPAVDADPAAVERMFARLLAATIGLAGEGEHIAVRLGAGGEGDDKCVRLSLTRPLILAGRDERTLLDPGYSPDGDWPDAPVLGLGFALRLVRNLAGAAGGRLEIDETAFALQLPARADGALSGNGRV